MIVIVGPTAVGKTAVAVELSRQISGEIVSADSMQVYRHMDIGTAKPTAVEQNRAVCHLIDIAAPDQQLTVSEWKRRAEEAIEEIRARACIPIVCGGTGLYVRALLDDWSLAATPADPQVRASLVARVAAEGSAALHAELASFDSNSAARLHPNDAVRIVRALEVYYASGVSISEHQRRDRERAVRRPARRFGLTMARQELYDRIDRRVDDMLSAGLEAEVRWLLGHGFPGQLSPMRSLGYNEMVRYIAGQLDWSETVSAIKQSTRRYAKRQLTWFRGDSEIEWIDVSALDSAAATSYILSKLDTKQHNQGHG